MDMHRVAARALGALAVTAGAAAAVVPFCDRPGGLALLAEMDHPVLLACLAAVCLAGAALLASRRADVRKGAGLALAGTAVLGVLAVPAYAVVSDPFPDREWDVPAPDGSGRRLVVERGLGLGDPVWRIYVDAGRFPNTRRHPVAEYAAGYPRGVLQATWTDASHIRLIDLDHTHHDLRISPDGRPLDALTW
ncbi:hypothetical protein ABZW32_32740 [Streptomyces sp. NPDC004667]|uniref:hypothetical protein n=1 Tax=Streptomyces sp. NPDC004667 TaxID=3154285 RepID=UPI0033B42B83